MSTIEKVNEALKGALPDNYFSCIDLDNSKLSTLLDGINKIDTQKDKDNDIIGRVYEYFLGKFALAEGKGKVEFYTSKCIVNLIAEMIEPYSGSVNKVQVWGECTIAKVKYKALYADFNRMRCTCTNWTLSALFWEILALKLYKF